MQQRILDAIELLKQGHPFRVDDVYMGIDAEGILNITCLSEYFYIENITKQVAKKELDETKELFIKMLDLSKELKEFIANKKIRYNVNFDYGMGDLRVCSEINGVIKWHMDLK